MAGLEGALKVITVVDLIVATMAVAVSLWLAYVAGWRPSWLAVWRRDQRKKWARGDWDTDKCGYCSGELRNKGLSAIGAGLRGGSEKFCDSLCHRAAMQRAVRERKLARGA